MSNEREQYDTEEAIRILARLKKDDRYDGDRDAAIELLQALKGPAKEAGLEVDDSDRDTLTFTANGSSHEVRFWVQKGKVTTAADERTYLPVQGIEFDPIKRIYVGTEEDKYRIPTPGKPRARRSAVAVLAEYLLNQFTPEP